MMNAEIKSNASVLYIAAWVFAAVAAVTLYFGEFEITHISALISNICVLAGLSKKYGLADPRSLFVLTCVPYLAAPWFDIYVYDIPRLYADQSGVLVVASAFFLCSFVVGGMRTLNISRSHLSERLMGRAGPVAIVAAALFMVIINVTLLYSWMSVSIGSVGRSEIYLTKPLYYDLGKVFVFASLAFLFWYSFILKNWSKYPTYIIIFCAIIISSIDILILGDRRNSVMLVIALFYIASRRVKISIFHIFLLSMSAMFLWMFSYFRNVPIYQWTMIYSNLDLAKVANPANSEFGAFSIVWRDLYPDLSDLLKPTYLWSPSQIIPSFLYGGRSEAPSVAYVNAYYPEIAVRGGGLAYNAIFESMQNFWYFGPPLVGLVLGRIFSNIDRYKMPESALFGIWLILTFSFMMRLDLTTLLRSGILSAILIYILLFLFCKRRAVL